jgi:glycosidase
MKIFPSILFLFVIFSSIGQTPNIGQSAPEWSKNATIYEVNIRQFTNEGTFRAFEEHLPRLKEMGVDIIWLMPIHPIGIKNRKGTLGSYYAVKDYTDVNPEFGKFEDFKNLVAKVHELDMKIIIDWVANHTSPDNIWVEQGHQDWYTLDSSGNLQPTLGTDWWDVADLNYDNLEMRKEMIESMRFWIKNADIDGFRCDVAGWVPMDFWVDAKNQLDEVKPIFFLAESEGIDQHQAFQMTYAWEFHHIMNKIAQKTENVQSIVSYFEREKNYPASAYRMNFTSNHDENSWNGTEMERLGKARFAMAVLSSTIMGMPLIYNGQETSLDRRLQFFEKDSIVWDKMDLVDFYTTLNDLHHRNQALWNGEYGGFPNIISSKNEQNVLAFVREKNGDKVLVIINLSSEERTFKIKNKSIKGNYSELFTKESLNLKTKLSGSIAPWSYKVYHITAN